MAPPPWRSGTPHCRSLPCLWRSSISFLFLSSVCSSCDSVSAPRVSFSTSTFPFHHIRPRRPDHRGRTFRYVRTHARHCALCPSARRVTLPSIRDEEAAIANSHIRSPGRWMSGKRLRYRGELSEADGGRPLSRYAGKGQPSTDSILFEAPKGCPIYKQLLGSFFLLNRSTSPLLILLFNKRSNLI